MMAVEDDQKRHFLRAGFDQAPQAYHRTRPVLPPRAFDDLISLAGLAPGARVAEIGCGTGQASVPLAERGMVVTAVELSAGLAAIARRRLAGFPSAEVVTSAFEDWEPGGGAFDAVVAVNSLHWIDPHLRYSKPHHLLKTGGAMIVGACHWAQPAGTTGFWTEVQEDYQAMGYEGRPPPPPEQIGAWHFPAEAAALFEELACRRYPFDVVYSTEDYLAILATQSGTRALGETRGADFLARVRHRLENLGSPDLRAAFVGTLTIGQRTQSG
jgi:SAM-dependent methyltransferase